MIVEIVTSEIDFLLMENIRYARIKAGFDQVELAQKLGVSEGYIGNIENPKSSAKANVRMIARIANALNLKSYQEIMPQNIVQNDIVRLRLDLLEVNTRTQVLDENGNVPERLRIISKEILTQNQFSAFKKNDGPYCKIIKK